MTAGTLVLYVVALATVFLTAFYMSRLFFLAFTGDAARRRARRTSLLPS